ncbi:hypothetical protein Hanom_Chr06g00539391 [Helianthus anomalus]
MEVLIRCFNTLKTTTRVKHYIVRLRGNLSMTCFLEVVLCLR